MPQFAVWQSRPLFVTSTFLDMQAERDYLHAHVFPVLRERLRERYHHLEPIDLRWGVETVSAGEREAKELLVLKVCLAEIQRSRPFLIALIGDRYGWQPPAGHLKAAAQEAGYAADLDGKSVTALEIEFGILDSPEQRNLSRFYFRDPLPYAQMDPADAAVYSDLHSGEPGAAEAHGRLEALKTRIKAQMPDRWRSYSATWGPNTRVTALKAWGDQVLEDVWADLEAATRDYDHAAPSTWQHEEAYVLEQFLEEKSHNFVGREQTVLELLDFALSPAAPEAPWGRAVTGGPGSGKSALFAHLARKLAGKDVLLLAHAAGIGPRSGQVDILLRRWIGELAAYLKEADPSETITNRDDLAKRFAEWLSRAAQRTRVVCLLDALNQFERTPATRHLTWLPELWPASARLIATTIPGSESEALGKRRGCGECSLPATDAADAGRILDTVCGRYHKTLHRDVSAALLRLQRPDGRLSCGTPLWVELAVEELLLLDAGDFARARQFEGDPDRQLHALLLDVAGELPADVEGLCGYLLSRNEDLHGKAFARAFAELIALSRTGWRESDLQTLIPAVTGEQWDPLRFAGLRRSFRAQLVQRGASGQWDFSHEQMRAAVERQSLAVPSARLERHRQIAAHLSGLDNDPLRQTELMFHLIQGDLRREAATLYSGPLSPEDGAGATAALASHILQGKGGEAGGEMEWVLSLAEQPLAGSCIRTLCVRWSNHLAPALADDAPVGLRRTLAERVVLVMEELQRRAPDSADCARDLAASYNKLGDLHLALGACDRALEFYQKALGISEELRRLAPDSADYASDLAVLYSNLGRLQLALGAMGRALEFEQKALGLMQELRRRAPDSAGYARDLSASYGRLGDLHLALGAPDRALEFYQKALGISEELRRLAPDSADYAHNLAVSYSKLGDLQLALGALDRAMEFYQKDLDISDLLRWRAPDSADYAHDLTVSYSKLGDLHLAMDAPDRALEFQQNGRVLMEELRWRAPDSADFARDLARSYSKLGDLHLAMDAPDCALDYYQKSVGILEELRRQAPDSADCARDLAVSYSRLGDLQLAMVAPDCALNFNQKSAGILEELRRRAPDSTDYARELAVSYARLGDLALETGQPGTAIRNYGLFLGLLDDFEQRIPGFCLDPSTPNAAILQHFLTQIRNTARAFYSRSEYYQAEAALEMLAVRGFDPADTGCHLARLYLLTGRESQALAAVEKAWQQRNGDAGYVPPRILFLRVLLAMLAGESPAQPLRTLKPLLATEPAHVKWSIAPVLDHLAPRLQAADLAFLRALAAALNDPNAMPVLEAQARWKNIESGHGNAPKRPKPGEGAK